jgi:electron transfer flavoprotein beta subunit
VKIAVCIKVVPSATHDLRLDPRTQRIVRGVAGAINGGDRHAIEEALQIAERTPGAEVIAVSVASSAELPAIREALAMGAKRAVLAADPAFAGSDLLPTSRALAAVLRVEAPDLVLFGPQGQDSGGAMLWAAVAERLGLPVLSAAEQLELADGQVTATRQTESGHERIRAALPCVVNVAASINQPRFPPVKGKLQAKSKPVALLDLAKLGLTPDEVGDAGSGTVVLAAGDPPQRDAAVVLKAGEDVAERIYAFLAERRLVA